MESLYILLGLCMFIFLFYSLYEIINIKKQINKIDGIVEFLLKEKAKKK